MEEKDNNLLLYSFAAFVIIMAFSLAITYFTFKTAPVVKTETINPVNQENNIQMQPVENNPPEAVNNAAVNQVKAEASPDNYNAPPAGNEVQTGQTDPENEKKIQLKLQEADGYLQNREFEKAETVFSEIASENKGTAWEVQANQAIENLKKIREGTGNAQDNVTLGNLRVLHVCLETYFAERGVLPDLSSSETARSFFESNCNLPDKTFFSQELKNIIVQNPGPDYKIVFELNSGNSYSLTPGLIK
jgi:hypothetical protein